jgi:GNAT superfamily N-acetyltransferase
VSSQPFLVRAATPDDAAAIAGLSGELGYPAGVAEMRDRLSRLCAASDHALLVACEDDRVIGWLHASVVEHLQASPRVEIGGLVVAEAARGRRAGATLVAEAERWARERGFTQILVRSQIAREDAHRFYLREGYTRTKTSAVFSKPLQNAEC